MELKLSVREKELNVTIFQCVQNEENLDESEKEIMRLRKENEYKEVEIEHKIALVSIIRNASNEMRRHKDMKIEEYLEAMNSLKRENTRLKREISDMRIVMESSTVGLQEEKVEDHMEDCTIEELNEKVCRITKEKIKMKNENDKSIDEVELYEEIAEDEFVSQQWVKRQNLVFRKHRHSNSRSTCLLQKHQRSI